MTSSSRGTVTSGKKTAACMLFPIKKKDRNEREVKNLNAKSRRLMSQPSLAQHVN